MSGEFDRGWDCEDEGLPEHQSEEAETGRPGASAEEQDQAGWGEDGDEFSEDADYMPESVSEEEIDSGPAVLPKSDGHVPARPPSGRSPGVALPRGGLGWDGQRKPRGLVKPDEVRLTFSPHERLLILDTWQRSGLPAGDFAPLVGISKHTLYLWKKRFSRLWTR